LELHPRNTINASKKPLIEYFQEKMKVVMTRWKTVVTMEIVAVGNQIEKSNSIVSWTNNGVSNHHLRKNNPTQ
jgi:hypothetical protein